MSALDKLDGGGGGGNTSASRQRRPVAMPRRSWQVKINSAEEKMFDKYRVNFTSDTKAMLTLCFIMIGTLLGYFVFKITDMGEMGIRTQWITGLCVAFFMYAFFELRRTDGVDEIPRVIRKEQQE